ncbi:endonuclease domain-containing protein [Saccharicrinis sp. 156]|uniref:endonuclease domain-containing protein n=1 Tax=Saccharicrinis sp. 156 TaxID=3417574 RepID=UPI003D349AC4
MKSNSTKLKQFRRHLRNNSTPAETELWKYLKNKQVNGLRFRRQHPIGNYILDFYCVQIKLAIELDGEVHVYNEEYDLKRDTFLNEQGISVLRYENKFVFEFLEQILEEIEEFYKGWLKRGKGQGK